MPGITRLASQLRSRRIRLESTGGSGVRSLSRARQGGGGIQNFFQNWGGKLVGWVSSGLNALTERLSKISVTDIFAGIVSGTSALINFDFQVTDKTIDTTIDAINKSVITRGFGAAGRSLGTAIAGVGGTAAITKFNPTLGAQILTEVSPEIANDLTIEWSNALSQAGQAYSRSRTLAFYKSSRRALKDPNNPFGKALRGLLGNETIEKWGDPGNEEWTFKKGVGDAVKRVIKDEEILGYLEEFWEELQNGLVDTGFIITQAIDNAIGMQNYHGAGLFGRIRTVEVQPNRQGNERIILQGTEQALRTAITTTLATEQLLDNRDIGQVIVAEDDQPILNNNGIEIELVFYSTLDTPWGKENRLKLARHNPKIPNIDRSKFSWEFLEANFRPSAFIDGNETIYQDLDNGRKIVCRGSTRQEALKLCQKLLQVTEAKPVGTPYYGAREGQATNRWKPRKHQPMYLYDFIVRNYDRATKYQEQGRLNESKQNISKTFKFRNKTKPVNFDILLNKAFSKSTDGD